jgi:HAD superfamily hydrolase (TIGR01549 family)
MDQRFKHLKAVVFDYGNTLVEFSKAQVTACDTALANALMRLYGPPDLARLTAIRDRDRRAPYLAPDLRENNLVEITTNMIRELYGIEPSGEEIADILRARFDIFVRIVRAEPYVFEVLDNLSKRYKLGLLSNYPDGDAIRASLKATGLDRYFDAVVISGDLGVVKPHPVPFLTILRALRVKPSQAVLVGDNWLGDMQGAKQAGMQAVFIRQWQTPEVFEPEAHHIEPDAVIQHLTDLLKLL